MRLFISIFLCLTIPCLALADDDGYKLKYDGGSIGSYKAGTGMKMSFDQKHIRILKEGTEVISLAPATVTEISYGQDVHRRVGAAIGLAVISFGVGALMALTKSKKHFIGLTWQEGDKKGGVADKWPLLAGPPHE